jgi:hypothetical protein
LAYRDGKNGIGTPTRNSYQLGQAFDRPRVMLTDIFNIIFGDKPTWRWLLRAYRQQPTSNHFLKRTGTFKYSVEPVISAGGAGTGLARCVNASASASSVLLPELATT